MSYINISTQVFVFDNFQIIPLSTCGSTSLTARESGWLSVKDVTNNFDPIMNESKKTYVCVRSPQSRFPSALKEALYRRNLDAILEEEMLNILNDIQIKKDPKPHLYELLNYIKSTKLNYENYNMESHLAPLWSHFRLMPQQVLDKLVFIDLSDLSNLWKKYTGEEMVKRDGGSSTSGHGGYEKWTEIIQSDQKLIDLIDETYAEDYTLFDRVQKL